MKPIHILFNRGFNQFDIETVDKICEDGMLVVEHGFLSIYDAEYMKTSTIQNAYVLPAPVKLEIERHQQAIRELLKGHTSLYDYMVANKDYLGLK